MSWRNECSESRCVKCRKFSDARSFGLTERRDDDEERIARFDGQLCNFGRLANPANAVAQAGRYCGDRDLRT